MGENPNSKLRIITLGTFNSYLTLLGGGRIIGFVTNRYGKQGGGGYNLYRYITVIKEND